MSFGALKVVAVEQFGDTLTAVFNDGRTVAYSVSMLDSECEQIQDAYAERLVKRPRARMARRKRVGSESNPLRWLRSRTAS